ncbi:heavy metal response regulator transcription factor [Acinetobacter sp.]|uniref:heavy metal response regulator transcription factor n=1 Tax=Acinetobacter sp. TaxID=472 RepID=UPI00388D1D76
MKILIVEDQLKTAEFLAHSLQASGYLTTHCQDGMTALTLLNQSHYDCVILDVMLPQLDGWQVLKTLRTFSKVPVLMLTAKDEVADRVKGLELGADDYLIKPFSYIELLARMKRLIQRVTEQVAPCYAYADLRLDLIQRQVYRDQKLIPLTAKEFALLQLLMQHAGEILTRAQIASQVWNINFETDTNVVDVAIRRLRSKVDDEYTHKLIHTVRGIGYRLGDAP